MKNFFLVIINVIAGAVLKAFSFIKSLHFKAMFVDVGNSMRSAFSPAEHDRATIIKRALLVAVPVILLAVTAGVKKLAPSKGSVGRPISLKDPQEKDEEKNRWSLSLVKGQSGNAIAASGTEPGGPYIVKTEAQAKRGAIVVGVTLEGQAGEKYVPGVMKNGQWQQPPSFTIVSESGKVISTGRFEYG